MCDRNDLLALMFSNFWRLQTPRATGKRLEQIIQIIDGIIDDEAWTCHAKGRNYGKSARLSMADFAPT
jgi:hypothetical protein